jgi:acyl carrier protein
MVPAAVVPLESLPVTANGKVDRKALPAPDRSGFEAEGLFIAPRTPIEEMVAAMWRELLSVPRVGVHDNFFDLGGHSLLATRLISKIRDAFTVELPLRRLFESPTVEATAAAVTAALASLMAAQDAAEVEDRPGPGARGAS